MKAEVVTFIRAYNYGAVLQSYALSQCLIKQGIDVEVLDYFPPYFRNQYSMRTEAPLVVGFRPYRRWLLKVYARFVAKKRNRRFERFIRRFIPVSPRQYLSLKQLEHMPPKCDCYIVGSDQVWSPYCAQFDPVFFLDFSDAKKKKRYSYAASFGVNRLPENMEREYCRRLSTYQKYSVREKSGVQIVEQLLKKSAQLCCDPTLLLEQSEWECVASARKEKEPYILVYYVAETRTLQEYARRLAKEKGMKVICVPTTMLLEFITGRIDRRYGFDVKKTCGPEELLTLFRNAEYVLTNSFHGTVFSIIFHKKFLVQTALDGEEKNTRAIELMDTLGIYGRELVKDFSKIDETIPWDNIDKRREHMKAMAEQYLQEIRDS